MNVFGYAMTEDQVSAGRAVFLHDTFSAEDVVEALEKAKVPRDWNTAERAAGLLIDAARANGEIFFDDGHWHAAPTDGPQS